MKNLKILISIFICSLMILVVAKDTDAIETIHHDEVLKGVSNYNNTTYNSAHVNIGLPKPEIGWNRFDDSNSKISYLGEDWYNRDYYENYCSTIKTGSEVGDKIVFDFKGTGFRLMEKAATACAGDSPYDPVYDVCSVYLDGKKIGDYDDNLKDKGAFTYQYITFECLDLENTNHHVEVVKSQPQYTIQLDAVDIKNGELIDNSTSQSQQSIVEYQTHVAKDGWLPWVRDDKVSGTTGQAKQIEAIRIKLLPPYNKMSNLHVEYRAHVAEYGWLPWVRDGEIAGTTGEARRVEAFQVRIVDNNGNIRRDYNIGSKYVHVAKDGWIPGNLNGGTIGTTGQSKRIEAFDLYCYHMK